MASDRLTRQELSWLLAQEARSAADLLRKGAGLAKGASITPVVITTSEPTDSVPDFGSTLDALDDAMRALASLHTGTTAHGRRGRIDLAAMLLELAPSAAVNIEPGVGTEVFGDELELRRILQVLLSLGMTSVESDAAAPATVRRQGDSIRVTVSLGPDSSAGARMEYAWLHRQAVRHGGKFEVEGSHLALELPADADMERKELAELRRELAAAQEQGEAYARELASMFTRHDTSIPPPAPETDFVRIVRFARALSSSLSPGPVADAVARFAALEPEESVDASLASLVALDSRLSRLATERDVRVDIVAPPGEASVHRRAVATIAALLAGHAIAASPKGGVVTLTAEATAAGVTLIVEDGGSRVPMQARDALLSLAADPATLGRPAAVDLFLASVVAQRVGGTLHLEDAASGPPTSGPPPSAPPPSAPPPSAPPPSSTPPPSAPPASGTSAGVRVVAKIPPR